MTAEQLAVVNTTILVLFIGLLSIGALRTVTRAIAYRTARVPLPTLLKRDLISRTGLTFPFVLILFARATGQGAVWGTQIWYPLLTGVPAIISVAVYAYYELFVIDKLTPEDRLARIERKLDENTRVSTDAFHEANTVNLKIEKTNQNIEHALEQAAHREERLEKDRSEAKNERRQIQADETEERREADREAGRAEVRGEAREEEKRRETDREAGREEVRGETREVDLEAGREADREVGREEIREENQGSMRQSVDETRREVGDLHRDRFQDSDDEQSA